MTEPVEREEPRARKGFLFARAITGVLGRIPLWATSWLVLWLLALLVAIPWHARLTDAVTGRYPLGEAVADLDLIFRTDHGATLDSLGDATARAGAVAALLAALFGAFCAGGWLQVILERTHGQSLRRFFHGGARYFWRFVRVWLMVLLVLAGLRWVFYELPWNELVLGRLLEVPASDYDALETLDSELSAHQVRWAQAGLFGLSFALVLAWGIYTRTRIALFHRRSAFLAGLASAWLLLAHPIRTLGPLFLLVVVELAVLLGAGLATGWIDARLAQSPTLVEIAALHLVAQLALVWREITRGASYYAAVEASRGIMPLAPEPDPWKTIGGPGGPQYPVDGGDEYGVAL